MAWSLLVDAFFRKKLLPTEKTLLFFLGKFARATFRLLARRSDRLLCRRRIAMPFSSVEKSNPRCTDLAPVDISVRLAVRKSMEGRPAGNETQLPVLECEREDAGPGVNPENRPGITISWDKSRWGSFAWR